MKMKWLAAICMAAVLTLTNGCLLLVVGAAAGAGAVVYVNGELKETEGASLDRTYNAAISAVGDLQYSIVSSKKDALNAEIVAQTALGKRVDVTLKNVAENTTEIRIRVGTVGDKDLSQQLLDKIKSRL